MTRHQKADVTASRTDEVQDFGPTKKGDVKIMPAKGRPMLTWVGKQPLSRVTAFPAQHVETFESLQSAITNPKSDILRNWPQRPPVL